MHFKLKFSIILSIILLILTGCGSSSGSSGTNPPSGTSLGTLPNGSTLYVSSSNFNISTAGGSTSGTLSIYGGTPGYSGTITTSISSSSNSNVMPTVTLSPSPCVLVAGNSAKSSCQLTISVESDVANGVYIITPSFSPTNNPESVSTLGTFSVTISNDPGPSQPGSLVIQLNRQVLGMSESSFATITLTNSTRVSNLPVIISSTNPDVLTLTQNGCNLSTESNSCVIHYTGNEIGSANIAVAATGYTSVTSESIIVNPLAGSLAINLAHNPLIYGESTIAHVSLNGSLGVESFAATIKLSDESMATLSANSCILSSLNNSCSIIVTDSNNESKSGTISVSAPNYAESSARLDIVPKINNTISIVVNAGSPLYLEYEYYNAPYADVTICASESNCQTINYVMIDTGSTGLRISASALNEGILSNIAPVTYNSLPVYECMIFGSGYQFGASVYATVKLADEVATNLPMTIVDDNPNQGNVPQGCSQEKGGQFFNPAYFGANGILGINVITQPSNQYTPILYTLSNQGFNQIPSPTDVPVKLSVNPISAFSRDNNGAIMTFPAVPVATESISGTLTFGINTQLNNIVSESINKILGNPNNYNGDFKAVNMSMTGLGLFDSGTNGYEFNSYGSTSEFKVDGSDNYYYCANGKPSCPWVTTVSNHDGSGTPITLNLAIQDPFLTDQNNVYPDIAAPTDSTTVTYGLPFFFGRSVYLGFNNVESTALGASPAWGFTN